MQATTAAFALPCAEAIVLKTIALWRAVREDWADDQARDRELRRRLRALAERL